MPPKRKRADDATEPAASSSTRATRSSTRSSTNTKNAEETTSANLASVKKTPSKAPAKPASQKKGADAGTTGSNTELEAGPLAKKSRTTGSAAKSATAKKQTARKGSKSGARDDTPEKGQQKPTFLKNLPLTTDTKATFSQSLSPVKNGEVYSPQRAQEIFNKYADSDDPDLIGPEGFEQLCNDADMPLDGSLPLILAWLLKAKEMAKISRDEWSNLTASVKISSLSVLKQATHELESLLILGRSPETNFPSSYNRDAYYVEYMRDSKAAFLKLYMFCFALAKTELSRNIDMETSTAFWSVLLAPRYPIMKEVLEFINENGSYRATNKDLWSMMLEFCQTVDPDLKDYEADGAWPTLLDDFVAWKRSKTPDDHDGNPSNN